MPELARLEAWYEICQQSLHAQAGAVLNPYHPSPHQSPHAAPFNGLPAALDKDVFEAGTRSSRWGTACLLFGVPLAGLATFGIAEARSEGDQILMGTMLFVALTTIVCGVFYRRAGARLRAVTQRRSGPGDNGLVDGVQALTAALRVDGLTQLLLVLAAVATAIQLLR